MLSKNGGVFPKLLNNVKKGITFPIGTGKQYMPWIHIDDLTGMIKFLVEKNHISGTFNAVSQSKITNAEFTERLSRKLKRIFLKIPIPAFLLRLVLGEMSILILYGSRISSKKIEEKGYEFAYNDIEKAFNDLIS